MPIPYPETLTLAQADRYHEFHSFYDAGEALEFVKKTRGQAYTQVDTDGDQPAYERGFHWVNRTGFYIVLFYAPDARRARKILQGCGCTSCRMNRPEHCSDCWSEPWKCSDCGRDHCSCSGACDDDLYDKAGAVSHQQPANWRKYQQ